MNPFPRSSQASLGHEFFQSSEGSFSIHSERCRAQVRSRLASAGGGRTHHERNGPVSDYEGLRLKIGNVHVCAYSVSSAQYDVRKRSRFYRSGFHPHKLAPPADAYPAATNRSCCTVVEYLFHNAIESDRKANADMMRMSTQLFLGISNILTAFFAYIFWADWRRSSAWASIGFLFPFVWIFIINSMPFSKLADIDIDDATQKTSIYMMGQLGYSTKDELWNLGTDVS